MNLKDAASLVHFRELHFLPRVIFSVGAILLIGAFFVRAFALGLFGVGVVFAASTLNLGIGTLMGSDVSVARRTFDVRWMLLCQAALALALSVASLSLTYYYYRHGEMPSYLQPLPKRIDLRPSP